MSIPFRVERLIIKGYRVLGHVEPRLKGLNVLIGPNGSGKSTFLDAVSMLGEIARDELDQAVVNRGGLERMLTKRGAERLRLAVEAQPIDSGPPILYQIELVPQPLGFRVAVESLEDAGSTGAPSIFKRAAAVGSDLFAGMNGVKPHQALLPRYNKEQNERMQGFLGSLGGVSRYFPIALDERAPIRLPQTLRPGAVVPSASGDNLLSVLTNLRSNYESWYEQIMDTLAVAFPGFRKLEIAMVGAGQATLKWYSDFLSEGLFLNELSSGTLRFLHLATLLLSPELPATVLIDEPEDSLHPELLRLLATLLLQVKKQNHAQIFVATHSAALLRWLQPEDVLVFDCMDGLCQITRGDDLDLAAWLEEYTLDQLWEIGRLGGRP